MFGKITFFIPLLLVMMSGITHAAPGDLDTTFNPPNAVVTYDGGIWRDWGSALAIQSDGKIVVAGGSYTGAPSLDVLVLRYNADGSPDNGFGTNGVVTYDGGSIDFGWGMAIQPDGKIVVVGHTHTLGSGTDHDLLVLRYNADGSPDNGFGTNGVVTYDSGTEHEYGRLVAIQPDGKIVVGGGNGTSSHTDLLVFRYNADGSPDNGFGTNGVVTYDGGSEDWPWGMAIQPDGKIVVVGYTHTVYGTDHDLLVLRYNADGSLDRSFGTNGVITYDSGSGYDYAEAVAIQPDGKIVVAGWGQHWDVLLFRYNADGSLDNSFGTNGVVAHEGEDGDCVAVAIQSDGKIVTAGLTYNGTDADVGVFRYNADGSPDNGFGTNGVATYDGGGSNEYVWAVAIQSDGNIVIAGEGHNGSNYDVLVLRLIGGGSEPIPASVDIKPDTLNTKSKGRWITCYIELSDGYSVEDIDVVALTQLNRAPIDPPLATVDPSEVGDYDDDGIPDLMVKFDRQELIALLEVGDAEFTIAGELGDGTAFEGSDTIRVIRPGK